MSKIECPICNEKAKILETDSYEYIYCSKCKRSITPKEQIMILRRKNDK